MTTKIVAFNGRNENLFDHLDTFAKSSSSLFLDFLYELNVRLPRKLRIEALRFVLRPTIEGEKEALLDKRQREEKLGLIDFNRFERIKYFDYLSETQLENELYALNDKNKNYRYLKKLWEVSLKHLIDKGHGSQEFESLMINAHEKSGTVPPVKTYNRDIDPYFIDEKNHLDGVAFDEFKRILEPSSTVKELTDIGLKYEITIPATLKKEDLKTMVIAALDSQGKLDNKLKATVEKAKIKDLVTIAEKYGLNVTNYMTKEKAIDYLLVRAQTPRKNEKETKISLSNERLADIDHLKATLGDMLKRIDALETRVEAQNRTLEDLREPSSIVVNRSGGVLKRLLMVFSIIGVLLIGVLLLGYFFDDRTAFIIINRQLNRIPLKESGLVDLFHRVMDFLLR